ncbi:MAG TPA: DUF2852 domain-containing protein [Aestuariivirga sp.]|nr:DUF2852 domain-containing protein [Aestuariivirga sp.]
MTQTATGPLDHAAPAAAGKKPWSMLELATMVGGFVVFWPVGLGALFLKMKNGEIWQGASTMTIGDLLGKARDLKVDGFKAAARGWNSAAQPAAGNAAFADYKAEALARLDDERRRIEAARARLDDEEKEFAGFVARLRAAKDREEFERFMAERQTAADRTGPTDPGL